MNLVDALQGSIMSQVVGKGMMPALPPGENLVNVVGDDIVEGLVISLPVEIPQGNNYVQRGELHLENLLISLMAEEQCVDNRATKKGLGMPEEILASQDHDSVCH